MTTEEAANKCDAAVTGNNVSKKDAGHPQLQDAPTKQASQIIMKRPDGLTLSISDFSNEHLTSLISVFQSR